MLTEQVKMKRKTDNDKIKKSVQTSSACGIYHKVIVTSFSTLHRFVSVCWFKGSIFLLRLPLNNTGS